MLYLITSKYFVVLVVPLNHIKNLPVGGKLSWHPSPGFVQHWTHTVLDDLLPID